MDFFSLASLMARRWFVVLPVLLLALVVGVAFVGSPEERFESAGSELLRIRSEADPASLESQEIETTITAIVLASALGQAAALRNLADEELSGSFTASVDPSGSILVLRVSGGTPEDAAQTANSLLDLAPSLLENIVGEDAVKSIRLAPLGRPFANDAIEIDGEFVVTAYMSVLAPQEVINPFPPNNSTAQLLVELSRRTELAEAVNEVVPGGAFNVQLGGGIATPLVSILVSAEEPSDVVLVYDVVVEQLEAQLVELQEGVGVSAANQTILFPLVEPTLVEQAASSVVRAAAGIALLGFAAAALLALFVDTRLRRRTEQKLLSTQWDHLAPREDPDRSEKEQAKEDQNRTTEIAANS